MSLFAGQLDLFTGAPVDVPAAPVTVRRSAPPPLEPGQVRYTTFRGQRDCEDCGHAQAAAYEAGRPVPTRRRATASRQTAAGRTYLCELHKTDRQAADTEVEV
ncbi:hypothetical protein [Catellatospora coxensis]|uniref:Uncharacterized protein n=1 Tax=Catellatospora coxensis TaxID=310354 RepID=A0A8J3L9P6_9ACTN|nr:hypothetical protein [Catellatospora coxensis]GIG11061.1 hypothetical protein Cco03nite_77610 [Catellatospora coxensis]